MKRQIVRISALILIFSAVFFCATTKIHGQQCGSKDECEKTMRELEQKLADTKKQKNTLASEIDFMDTQIRLTTVKIQNTENEVKTTTSEIESLSGKIESLNTSLDYPK